MFPFMPSSVGAMLPRLGRPIHASTPPRQYGLIDAFLNPVLVPVSTGGGLIGAWGSAAAANPSAISTNKQKRAYEPVKNFHRPTTWDPDIGAYVPLVIDKAGNRLHPFVAGLIDNLVTVDPESDEQISQARLGIDRLLTDSSQTRNWFHKTLSDYLAGDLTPEEARAEYADRGDERFRANRATANLVAEGILAAEGVRQAAPLPVTQRRQIPGHRTTGVPGDPEPLPPVSHTKDPMTEAEYRALPDEGLIDPNRIRTLQDSIGPRFKPEAVTARRKHIKETIDELRSGATRPEEIEPIKITLRNAGVWTLDHRRLVAARLAGVPVRYRKVWAESISKKIGEKNTTIDDGMSIVIRPEKGEKE